MQFSYLFKAIFRYIYIYIYITKLQIQINSIDLLTICYKISQQYYQFRNYITKRINNDDGDDDERKIEYKYKYKNTFNIFMCRR